MSFFDQPQQTPQWYLNRQSTRRQFLKSASVAAGVGLLPKSVFAEVKQELLAQDPWLTFDAVLNHLLPSSESGPGAQEIKALNYLYILLTQQPIDEDEKNFIKNGVNWLNGYTQQSYQKKFIELDFAQKEASLRGISRSRAGENWISTLLSYLFEAMLAPASYGGNPDGIGWQWLEHQAGFPMPPEGKRYYELPGQQIIVQAKVNPTDNNQKANS